MRQNSQIEEERLPSRGLRGKEVKKDKFLFFEMQPNNLHPTKTSFSFPKAGRTDGTCQPIEK
jgi:hypothetical protein